MVRNFPGGIGNSVMVLDQQFFQNQESIILQTLHDGLEISVRRRISARSDREKNNDQVQKILF